MPHRRYQNSGVRAAHSADARLQYAGAAAPLRAHDYTLVHAGRHLRIGPIAFWVVVGTLVIMAVWTITTATYFAFREDVLTRLIGRQAEMQFAYEDRIAELRAQVDRISSRQLLDQDQYEQKLDQIMRRQATLESRSSALNALPDLTITGSIKQAPRIGIDGPRNSPLKPSPINDTGALATPPDREARIDGNGRGKPSGGVDGALARLQASLDRVESRQAMTLLSLGDTYELKAQRIREVLSELGIRSSQAAASASGGPFVPLRSVNDAATFERQIQRVTVARAQMDRLTRTLVAIPIRKPIPGELELSSGFGIRIDPFIRAPAMHTGVDFRGDMGEPVRVTANGTVTTAGWSGGYGRMVEVDHGNGLATRYGHLSVIDVSVGQTVKIGQVIGRVGSTGRSTGPHLHYETRVDGEAVDPQKFLRAGIKLGPNF